MRTINKMKLFVSILLSGFVFMLYSNISFADNIGVTNTTKYNIYTGDNGKNLTKDFNFKSVGKVDDTTYYGISYIPNSLTGNSIGGKTIKESSNCSDINNSCVEAGYVGLFVMTKNGDEMMINDVLEFYDANNSIKLNNISYVNNIRKNEKGDIFILINFTNSNNEKVWKISNSTDITSPNWTSDSPQEISQVNTSKYESFSYINDYLIYNYTNGNGESMFNIYDFSDTTPVKTDGTKNTNGKVGFCFKYPTSISSSSDVNSENIESFSYYIADSNSRFNRSESCITEDGVIKNYSIYFGVDSSYDDFSFKTSFMNDENFYMVHNIINNDEDDQIKLREINFDGSGNVSSVNNIDGISSSKAYDVVGKYQLLKTNINLK